VAKQRLFLKSFERSHLTIEKFLCADFTQKVDFHCVVHAKDFLVASRTRNNPKPWFFMCGVWLGCFFFSRIERKKRNVLFDSMQKNFDLNSLHQSFSTTFFLDFG